MRILVVSTDYPPMLGGIAQNSAMAALHFHQHGHEVRVIASAEDAAAADAYDAEQPFPTERVPGRLGLREMRLVRTVHRALREYQPEVVWSSAWYPGAVAVSYAAGDGGPVQTFSTHGSEIFVNYNGWKQILKAQLGPWRRRVFRGADTIFANSRYTRDKVIEMGAPAEKMVINRAAVSQQWFEVKRRPRSAEAPPVLLTVARLDEHKGHDVTIRALPRVLERFPDLRYVMVGPGEENWPRLRRLAEEAGVLGAIDYRGRVSDEDVRAAYAEADVFVMLSREMPGRLDLVEGFGLTFLEAAAVGLPSVAGNSGGIPDAVEDGVSGLLVDPYSPEETAEAICRLLGDRDLAARLGRQGRERAAAKFSWNVVVQLMLDAFAECLARRSRTAASP